MKLIGKLKENVEKAENKEHAKEIIAEAGMLLDDTELDKVAGGVVHHIDHGTSADIIATQQLHRDMPVWSNVNTLCGFGLPEAAFLLPVLILQTSAIFKLQNGQLSDETE